MSSEDPRLLKCPECLNYLPELGERLLVAERGREKAEAKAALVPDPLRRRTLLDRLCWWRR